MVKKVKIKVAPKGVGKMKDSQQIYLNTRVKKAMGCWHPKYNPKFHRYKYLHGSVMMACGYRRWVVWWDDSYNWNRLYTGDGYHSAGLKICDKEDIQGFSDIPVRERVKHITDTMDYDMESNEEKDPEDSTTNRNTELAFNHTNPHTKFIHYNTVTPTKEPKAKTVHFENHLTLDSNLFRFTTPEPQDKDNNQQSDDMSEASKHSFVPDSFEIEKSGKVNQPNDEDSFDTAKFNEIMPHDNETSELDMWKDRMKNLVGTKVYVPFDKTKNVEWVVEKIIDNKNTHIEESSDFHPVYDYRHMDPSKINPLKNFLEIFPEDEMRKCVELFNSQVEENNQLPNTTRETKYCRNKTQRTSKS